MSQQSTDEPTNEPCCTAVEHDLTREKIETDAGRLAAMGAETRYEILRLLDGAPEPVCACDLTPHLDVDQSTTSRALKRLSEAGLVDRRKDGRWRYYSVTNRAKRLLDALSSDPESSRAEIHPGAGDKRDAIRDRYGSIAAESAGGSEADDGCCGSSSGSSSCCGDSSGDTFETRLGYDPARVEAAPEGANLGLGCGNPLSIADLSPGETLLDLGSGGGFDCFLAAQELGPTGRVIGVDMTPEMVERARRNAERSPHDTVEFRLGEIESLPVSDASVDVITSNCVVNLSTSKSRVFEEAFRVLKPGGRLAISDIVLTERGQAELDDADLDQYASCLSGAVTIERLQSLIEAAGFESVSVRPKAESDAIVREMYGEEGLTDLVHSAHISGYKPDR
ncbi:MAG: arsenite methyltransferase [Halobacteriota archaeon]